MILTQGDWLLAHADKNSLEMLVMIGSDEGIVNKDAVDQFCQKAPRVSYKVWPDLYHELHNEPEKKDVFDFTLGWLKKHI
jgi:alpha-beta hydrolase superfamily lysophospholipase